MTELYELPSNACQFLIKCCWDMTKKKIDMHDISLARPMQFGVFSSNKEKQTFKIIFHEWRFSCTSAAL